MCWGAGACKWEVPWSASLIDLDWKCQVEETQNHYGWDSLHTVSSPCSSQGPTHEAAVGMRPNSLGVGCVPTGSRDMPSWEGPTGIIGSSSCSCSCTGPARVTPCAGQRSPKAT